MRIGFDNQTYIKTQSAKILERVKLFEKYADYTVSEEGLSLEETIDMVLELLDKSL